MNNETIRDRVWLWGMKVNVLQDDDGCGFDKSTMTTEEAIERTGVTNVMLAGGLPITEESLASMPHAGRIVTKGEFHMHKEGKLVSNYDSCLSALFDAKKLAHMDRRVEAFLLDDFSSGSIDAGVRPEHLAELQFKNAVYAPRLPLGATIYTMDLDKPELPGLLPFFDSYLVPLWHADQIESLPHDLSRLADMSGGKPMLLCLYVYDFGDGKLISRDLMQRHLDMAERLLREERVTGLCICGTCMMDLDWEANHCFYDWIERVGASRITTGVNNDV